MSQAKITCQFCQSVVSEKYLKRHQDTATRCLLQQDRCKTVSRRFSDEKYVNHQLKIDNEDQMKRLKGVFEGFLLNTESKRIHQRLLDDINLCYDQGYLFDEEYINLTEIVNDNFESCKKYSNMVLNEGKYLVIASSGSPPVKIATPSDMTEAIANFQYIISTIQNTISTQLAYHMSAKSIKIKRDKCSTSVPCEYPCQSVKSLIGKSSCKYTK